jgi:putative tricarboxylic transport membrane protein
MLSRSWWGERLEFVLSALLAGWGVALLVGANNIRVPATANVVDPRFLPRVVGVGLLTVAALHAYQVARGKLGEPDEGEDIDLSKPGDWKAFLTIVGSVIVHAKLIRPAGWPIAAALLFFGCAMGLGAKSVLRTVVISVVLAGVTYWLFAKALGVYLPRGILDGII